jgi:hypothetical protein
MIYIYSILYIPNNPRESQYLSPKNNSQSISTPESEGTSAMNHPRGLGLPANPLTFHNIFALFTKHVPIVCAQI